MAGKLRWRVLLVGFSVLAVACGDDGGSAADLSGGATDPGQTGDSANGDPATGGGDVPDLDPAVMPPPGEARVEVAGETFVFKQSDMLEGVFACEISDNGISINFQSDRHDMSLQGAAPPDGAILASTTVSPEESDLIYSSSNGGGNGGVAVDGSHVLYSGQFTQTVALDRADSSDAGVGTVAVTCA